MQLVGQVFRIVHLPQNIIVDGGFKWWFRTVYLPQNITAFNEAYFTGLRNELKFNLSCSNSQQVKFVELPNTDYYGFDLNYSPSVLIQDCRNLCLDDCRFEAFSHGCCSSFSMYFG